MASCTGKTSDPRVQVTPCGVLRSGGGEEGAGKRQQQGKSASPSAYLAGVLRTVTVAPEAAVTLKNSQIFTSPGGTSQRSCRRGVGG